MCFQIPGTKLIWWYPRLLSSFQGVSLLVFLTTASHTWRGWRRYIPSHLRLLFLWFCILRWFHLGCIQCGCGFIQVAWVVSWGRSLICLLSWIWRILWVWRYWRVFWQPAYRPWPWLLCLDSLFGLCQLLILSFSLIFLYSHAADELPVCQVFFSIFWNVLPSDESYCVGWVFMRPPTPFARRPNSFADDVLRFYFIFGFLISCL